MEFIDSKDGIFDGQVQQTWMYHPDLAPKGQRFYTDELPDGPGWVDTPAKFPGFKQANVSVRKTERPDPAETYRYHKTLGAKRFMEDALPSEEDGWFDTPTAAAAWEGDVEPVPAKRPDPDNYRTLDTFMEAWCAAGITDDMSGPVKGSIKKEGIELYARVRFKAEIDRKMKLEDLVAYVHGLEDA